MGHENNMFFWRNPMSVLSITLLLIIAITGTVIFFLGDTLQEHQDNEYLLLSDQIVTLPKSTPHLPAQQESPDLNRLLVYIDTNFDSIPPVYLKGLINDILVLEPDNRDALILAAKLAAQEEKKAELVDITRTLYRLYPNQAYLYDYVKAMHDNNQSDQAYDVIRIGRENNIYSPKLDLLAAELAAANEHDSNAFDYWHKAGSPAISAHEYPYLAECIEASEPGEVLIYE